MCTGCIGNGVEEYYTEKLTGSAWRRLNEVFRELRQHGVYISKTRFREYLRMRYGDRAKDALIQPMGRGCR